MSTRSRLVSLFGNAGFILIVAFVMGLVYAQGALWARPALVPVIGIVMTLSVLSISSEIFLDLKRLQRAIFLSIVLNYVLLGCAFIVFSRLVISDEELLTGFVLVAAVPPAVAVIPYTYYLGGDVSFSLVGSTAAYLAALLLTPLMCILFLGTNFIEPTGLLAILVELIIVPLLLSRILRKTPLKSQLEKCRGLVVNWGFFVIVYTIVGLNRDVFLGQPDVLVRVSVVGFVCTFLIGELIDRVCNLVGVNKQTRISLMLMGTRKNYGLASAIAVVFFSDLAAMPSTVGTAFAIMHFIWLTMRFRREHREAPAPLSN